MATLAKPKHLKKQTQNLKSVLPLYHNVDYRDLNKASPKDDFPLPHIDMLVDSTTKFKVFSFMDGFSGYNQIRMGLEDMEKNNVYHTLGNILLQSDALQVEER